MPRIIINDTHHEVANPDLYLVGKLLIELHASGNLPLEKMESLITALDAKDTKAITRAVRVFSSIFHPDRYSGSTIPTASMPYAEAFATVYNHDPIVKGLVDRKKASSQLQNNAVAFANLVGAAFNSFFIPIDPETILSQDAARQKARRSQVLENHATDMAQIKPILRKLNAQHHLLLTARKIQDAVLSKIRTSDPIFENIEIADQFINDASSFEDLMHKLEQEQSPLAYLCCALLLSNNIFAFYDNKEDDKAEEEYFIKRYSDAIGFYMLAAKDPELLPAVRHTLSFLETDIQIRSTDGLINYLRNCCNRLEARPVMISSYNMFRDESKFDMFARLNKQVYAQLKVNLH